MRSVTTLTISTRLHVRVSDGKREKNILCISRQSVLARFFVVAELLVIYQLASEKKSLLVYSMRKRSTFLEEDLAVVGPDAEQRGVLVRRVTRELVSHVAVEPGVAVSRSHLDQLAADRCAFRHADLVDGPLELGPVVVGVQHGNVYLD